MLETSVSMACYAILMAPNTMQTRGKDPVGGETTSLCASKLDPPACILRTHGLHSLQTEGSDKLWILSCASVE